MQTRLLIQCYNSFRDTHRCSVTDVLTDPEFRGPFLQHARAILGPIVERDILKGLVELAGQRLISLAK